MLGVTFIFLLILNGILFTRFDVAVANHECNSNSDCGSDDVCCAGKYYWENRTCNSDSCSGRYCSTDGDCGGKGECCNFNKCGTYNCTECYDNSACATSEYCCKQKDYADVNVCRRSCVGEPCSQKTDCGGPGEKCDWKNECKIDVPNEHRTALIVLGAVFGSFVVFAGCIWILCFFRHRLRRTRRAPRTLRTPTIISYRKKDNRATLQPPPSHFNHGQNFAQHQQYGSPQPQQQHLAHFPPQNYTSPPPQQHTAYLPPQRYTSPLSQHHAPPQHHTSPPPQHYISPPPQPHISPPPQPHISPPPQHSISPPPQPHTSPPPQHHNPPPPKPPLYP